VTPLALRSLAVAAGGLAGTLARFGLNHASANGTFPLGTLAENLLGSLLLGLLIGWLLQRRIHPALQAGLGTGFCGGFTTMSTLASDLVLLGTDSGALAAGYLAASLLGGVLLALAGIWLGEYLGRRGSREPEEATPWRS
jgi:fluoride exporter